MEANIENIDDFFNELILKNKNKLEEEFDIKMTRISYNNLKKEVCKPDSKVIMDNILKKINKYPE